MHAAAVLDGGHRDNCKAGAKAIRTLLQPLRVFLRAAGLSYGLYNVHSTEPLIQPRAHDSIASWASLAMLSACRDDKESRLTASAVRYYVWRTFDFQKNAPLGSA